MGKAAYLGQHINTLGTLLPSLPPSLLPSILSPSILITPPPLPPPLPVSPGIRARVKELSRGEEPVRSGLLTAETKMTFRYVCFRFYTFHLALRAV